MSRSENASALLLFLYKTGARVSEATQPRVGDLRVECRDGGHALATLHGKGRKVRECPLLPDTERVMAELVERVISGETNTASRRRGTRPRPGRDSPGTGQAAPPRVAVPGPGVNGRGGRRCRARIVGAVGLVVDGGWRLSGTRPFRSDDDGHDGVGMPKIGAIQEAEENGATSTI